MMKLKFLWIKIVLCLVSVNLYCSHSRISQLLCTPVKGIQEEALAQLVTATTWGLTYSIAAPFVQPTDSFWENISNFEHNFLYKTNGYPKKWYKIARTVLNIGDICLSQGDLSRYVAKKSADWILTEVIAEIAKVVGKQLDSDIIQFSSLTQIPFRHFDEIMMKAKENKPQQT